MDAILSGLTGQALLLEENNYFLMELDAPTEKIPVPQWQLARWRQARDLLFLRNVCQEEVAKQLAFLYDQQEALDVTLILLDAELSAAVRLGSVEALGELCQTPKLLEQIQYLFFTRPLHEEADLVGAIGYCQKMNVRKLIVFLNELQNYQHVIKQVWKAWQAIPLSVFGDEEVKYRIQRKAIRFGVFYTMVMALPKGKLSEAKRQALSKLSEQDNYREIISLWTLPFDSENKEKPYRENVTEKQQSKDFACARTVFFVSQSTSTEPLWFNVLRKNSIEVFYSDSIAQAMAQKGSKSSCLILVDSAYEQDAVQTLSSLASDDSSTYIALLKDSFSIAIEISCMSSGLRGVLYKENMAFIPHGITTIFAGYLWFSRNAMDVVLCQWMQTQIPKNRNEIAISVPSQVEGELEQLSPLTSKETKVLQWMLRGAKNEKIAEQLHVSVSMVKSHIYSIYRKTGSRNRLEVQSKCTKFVIGAL